MTAIATNLGLFCARSLAEFAAILFGGVNSTLARRMSALCRKVCHGNILSHELAALAGPISDAWVDWWAVRPYVDGG